MRLMKYWPLGILLISVVQASVLMRQTGNPQPKVLAKILAQSQQLVLVTTKDWNAVDGELRRYHRAAGERAWLAAGEKVPVVVGRSGMAWGKGLHGNPAALAKVGEPIKKEGDGRS